MDDYVETIWTKSINKSIFKITSFTSQNRTGKEKNEKEKWQNAR